MAAASTSGAPPASAGEVISPLRRAGGSRRAWSAGLALRLLLVVIGVTCAGLIAARTEVNGHPDEFIHVDAFRYFATGLTTHWTRPAYGSDEVLYTPMGWSRVYNGEIVYLLYGKLHALAESAGFIGPISGRVVGAEHYRFFRYCNVGLYGLTLLGLVLMSCRGVSLPLLATFVLGIPQVTYVFGYANSDAFGVAMTLLLFAEAACLLDRPAREWSAWRIALWMLTLLGVLWSKSDFALGALLPLAMVGVGLVRGARARPALTARWVLTRVSAPLLLVVLVAGLWSPFYALQRGTYLKEAGRMRERKAADGWKPSQPRAPNIYWAKQHPHPYDFMAENYPGWWGATAASYYAVFRYMDVPVAGWTYGVFYAGLIAATGLSVVTLARRRYGIPRAWWLWLPLALALAALNVAGSLYHTLHFDYQPQGRYLFATLACVFMVALGTVRLEGGWYRALHAGVILVLVPLAVWILLAWCAFSPLLSGPA
jgi:hypothetical protein